MSLGEYFCLQAASQLLQQAIHIRQKYMAVSHQHFSPECSQILRERSPEVTLIYKESFSLLNPQPNDLGDPSFFVGMRPRVQSLGKLSVKVRFIALHVFSWNYSSIFSNFQEHPIHAPKTGGTHWSCTFPPSMGCQLQLHEGIFSAIRCSSSFHGYPMFTNFSRDGRALELPCPSLPVFVKDMQLMCQMIGGWINPQTSFLSRYF